MKKKLLTILKYLSFLGLGVFLVWWSLHQIPAEKWQDFRHAFATANYWLMVPVFFILIASHLLRAFRWKMLIIPMGYHPSLVNAFFAVMIGYLANLAVPRLGEVLKCTILARYENVPAEKLVGTIVAERAVDLLCLIIFFLLAFALQFQVIGEFGITIAKKIFLSRSGNFNMANIAVTILIALTIVFLVKILLKKYHHIPFTISIKKIVRGVWQGIISVKDLQHKWAFIVLSVGIWGLYLLGTWIGFFATSGTANLSIETAISGLAFASIGMIITPGGIGAYAFFLAKVLEQHDIPFAIGFANGTLQWFAQFLIIIFVGFISLGMLPYYNKKTPKHEETRSDTN